jgi:outer membrane protein OmpA-like peptidoglycan-associated protein
MKKRVFCMSFILLSFMFVATAQETFQNETKAAGYKTAFKHSGAGENWFVHVGAGGQLFFGDNDLDADAGLVDRIRVFPEIAVGKWFNPYFALRLKGETGSLSGVEEATKTLWHWQHYQYYNAHIDAMWNLTNYWGAYSPSKAIAFGPYLGLGFAHVEKNQNSRPYYGSGADTESTPSNGISINAGLNLGFNLSKRVSLELDLGTAILPDYLDRMVDLSKENAGKVKNDLVVSVSGGVTFKLGKIGFETVDPVDYALINDLNGKINSLRAENAQLSKRPTSCPECPPAVAPIVKAADINYVPNVVFFRLNSSKIDQNQQVSVYNTAEFINNTGGKIKVIGYADKGTGTSNYNLELSKKRAQAVAKELTTKYNIPSEKITVEWKGAGEQPYAKNNWNRVVVMSAPN